MQYNTTMGSSLYRRAILWYAVGKFGPRTSPLAPGHSFLFRPICQEAFIFYLWEMKYRLSREKISSP